MFNDEKIKRLVNSGLDEITFSVDGPDQDTYVRYRKGGDFNKVMGIMSKFVEERNKHGREIPFINWRYIIFKWNDSKIKMSKTKRLAKKIGVDRLTWEITDHPFEAASKRYQIGTQYWEKIYNEIWDSSQIGNAIKNKRYLAQIKIPPKEIIAPDKPNKIDMIEKIVINILFLVFKVFSLLKWYVFNLIKYYHIPELCPKIF